MRLSVRTFRAALLFALTLPTARAAAQQATEAERPAAKDAEGARSEPVVDPTSGPDPFRTPNRAAQAPAWAEAPVSASGTQLVPPAANQAAPADADAEARARRLEARVAVLEAESAKRAQKLEWLERVKIEGLVQPQLVWQWFDAAASPNLGIDGRLPAGISANDIIARPDGTTTNPNFFRVRRARLRTELSPTDFARLVVEIDPSGVAAAGGLRTGVLARTVEAVGIVPWSKDVKTEFGAGIFRVPFGREILQPDHDVPFVERSWVENNLFPGELDTGLRAYTSALRDKLALQLALVNGATLAEPNFLSVPDLNRGKDLVGRVNYDFGPFDVGVSGDVGAGQRIDPEALRFKNFSRWGVNFEAGFHYTLFRPLGRTRAFAELTLAQNLDRGLRYAFALPTIPFDIRADVLDKSQRGLFVRLEQDFSEWFTLGLRYDMYTPDTTIQNNARDTYAVVGAVNFTRGLRLLLEFDYAIDNVHAEGAPPPSRSIATLSSVLQAHF